MTLLTNTRCLNSHLTGVQRYTLEILQNFPTDGFKEIGPSKYPHGVLGHLWEQLVLPTKVKGNLLWSPSNTGPLSVRRQVLTLHDVVPLDHPEWLNAKFAKWYQFLLPKLVANVAHVITISEFSKNRIVELFNLPEEKVSVIYNGVSDNFFSHESTHEALDLPFERYVLSIGSLEPRKNLPFLISTWEKCLSKIPEDVGLVIVGAKGSNRVFKDAGLKGVPERVYFTGHVEDKHIIKLYQNALIFAYLSFYEGFGLPPLEAMAAGIPVLTGNLTSLPEVVGDAGVMIDPYSEQECRDALIDLINNESLRKELSNKGLKRAENFRWKTASQQTWTLLNKF